MRRERREYRRIPPEEKNEARQVQIDLCEQRANALNMGSLPEEAITAYQRLVSFKKTGIDTTDPTFREQQSKLITNAAPILKFGLNAGYLRKVFENLRIRTYIADPKSSFSLIDIEASPEGQSFDENKQTIEMFQDCSDAWEIVNNWSFLDGVPFFLKAVQGLKNPLQLPLLKRDLAARTGNLMDFEGFIGGARHRVPTIIYGVHIENDYESAEAEFPDLRIVVSKLS